MFIGSTRESQDKQAQMEVEARREAAAAFPFIRPVLQRFNGKVYNCRFEKALKEAAEIEEQAQQVELYRKRIEDTKRLLESVTGGINRTIRDIYGLDYYISRH